MAKIKLTDLIKESGTNVKSLGAGKMAHANTRTNLGRHRSSDILDKQSSKEHNKNTVKGLKASNYLPPHMREEETIEETKFGKAIGPIKKTMDALGYEGEYDPIIVEGYIFTKDLADGVMEITLTSLYDDEEKFTFTATYFPKINQSKFFGLLKKQVIDYKNGKIVSDDVEHVDLGTGMFSLDEPGVENLIKNMVSKVESKANTKGAEEMEEGKKQLAFVIPCPDAYDIEEEAEHFQYLLDKAGVKAKVKANRVGEEAEVYTKDEKKARKVIEKNGYQIGWNDDIEDNGEGESTQSDDEEQSHYLDIPTGPDKGWKNEMEEGSAFDYAALQAKKHHEKYFTVGGHKFPVKERARMTQLAGIKKKTK